MNLGIGQASQKKLIWLPIYSILPNSLQPRKTFDEYDLKLLADSIRQNGLLQPISVRCNQAGNYELIAGERRLRACKMAGLTKIPCILQKADSKSAAMFTIIENLQRSDLSIFEEANGIKRLIECFEISQFEAASQLGIAQSTLSNKLRLLRLSEKQQHRIIAARLTERHARAVLRLPEDRRDEFLDAVIARQLTLSEAEALAEEMLNPEEKHQPPVRKASVGDVRIFANSLTKIVNTMVKSGFSAKTEKTETDQYIEYKVRIQKNETQHGQMRIIV